MTTTIPTRIAKPTRTPGESAADYTMRLANDEATYWTAYRMGKIEAVELWTWTLAARAEMELLNEK